MFLILNPLTLFLGYNLGFLAIRDVMCNWSKEVRIDLAKPIVQSMKNNGFPDNITNIKNESYVLQCNKKTTTKEIYYSKRYPQVEFKQECYLMYHNQEYTLRLLYTSRWIDINIRTEDWKTNRYDFRYNVSNSNLRHLDVSIYENSKGICSQWQPFGEIWGH